MFGAVWAQAELRKVLASAGARVVEGELPVPVAHTRFDVDGRLTDEEARERLAEIVASLAAVAERIPVAA
jgi:chromate reductase